MTRAELTASLIAAEWDAEVIEAGVLVTVIVTTPEQAGTYQTDLAEDAGRAIDRIETEEYGGPGEYKAYCYFDLTDDEDEDEPEEAGQMSGVNTRWYRKLAGPGGLNTRIWRALGDDEGVVLASQIPGIHLNSDLETGGGTDDTAVIQAILDQAEDAPLHFILDGVALVSGLKLYSNTRFETLPGCGLRMAPSLNTPLLYTSNCEIEIGGVATKCWNNCTNPPQADGPYGAYEYTASANPTPPLVSNIEIIGGTFHHDGANNRTQTGCYTRGTFAQTTTMPQCFLFLRSENVRVQGVTIIDAGNYAFFFKGVENLVMEDCYVDNSVSAGSGGRDGVHFWGPVNHVRIRNFTHYYPSDDFINFSCIETPWREAGMDCGGDIIDVEIDGVQVTHNIDPLYADPSYGLAVIRNPKYKMDGITIRGLDLDYLALFNFGDTYSGNDPTNWMFETRKFVIPAATAWATASKWADDAGETAYTAGNLTSYNTAYYRCLANHTSAATHNAAGFAADYAAGYWVALNAQEGVSAWAGATGYVVGNKVTSDGAVFTCLVAHTSGTFATDLGTRYWGVENPPIYKTGDWVTSSGVTYMCIKDHNPAVSISTDNSGGNIWKSMIWVTATAYKPGCIVVESGNVYKCVKAHTSGTFATDLAAGLWTQLTLPYTVLRDGLSSWAEFIDAQMMLPVRNTGVAGRGTSWLTWRQLLYGKSSPPDPALVFDDKSVSAIDAWSYRGGPTDGVRVTPLGIWFAGHKNADRLPPQGILTGSHSALPNLDTDRSICIDFYIPLGSTGSGYLFNYGDWAVANRRVTLSATTTTFTIASDSAKTWSGLTLTAGVWHRVVCTYTGGTWTLYVDSDTAIGTDGSHTLATNLGLSGFRGVYSVGGFANDLSFRGFIRNVRVWSDVLTAGELEDYFAAGDDPVRGTDYPTGNNVLDLPMNDYA